MASSGHRLHKTNALLLSDPRGSVLTTMAASIGDDICSGEVSTADCWRHVLVPTVSEGSAMPLGKSCGFPVWQDGIWKCVLVTSPTAAWLAGSC